MTSLLPYSGKYPQRHQLEEPPELDPEYFMNMNIEA
jgi:hypothetical protein